jgi:hypothetical protein
MQEIYAKLAGNSETKEGDPAFVKEFRGKLKDLSEEYVKDLKSRVLAICSKSRSEILQISLYELLIRQPNGINEVRSLKSPALSTFINKLNISEPEPSQAPESLSKEQV